MLQICGNSRPNRSANSESIWQKRLSDSMSFEESRREAKSAKKKFDASAGTFRSELKAETSAAFMIEQASRNFSTLEETF